MNFWFEFLNIHMNDKGIIELAMITMVLNGRM
jgi:hypothetical protein